MQYTSKWHSWIILRIRRAGNGIKTNSCCAKKQLRINGERQRPEFSNSHKLCLSHHFEYNNIKRKKWNRQKFSADLFPYCITVR